MLPDKPVLSTEVDELLAAFGAEMPDDLIERFGAQDLRVSDRDGRA